MNQAGLARLTDTAGAWDEPVVRIVTITAAAAIALGLLAAFLLAQRSPALAKDIRVRTLTWIVLAGASLGMVVWCRSAAIVLIGLMSLWCYREFARFTGLFREKAVSVLVVLGIAAVTFTHLDNWPGMCNALTAVVPMLILIISVLQDRPGGYIQRCALSAAAFLLFGQGLGRLGALTVEDHYRSLVCAVLFCCQMSDVAAYCCGKLIGGPHVFANTSPRKTLGGHAGALLIVTPVAAWLYHLTFAGSVLEDWRHTVIMGFMTAVLAQLGDLVVSSIKRDVGVKDASSLLPGHGGLLDRCNSLLLVAPAMFHYVNYFKGVGAGQIERIITGGLGVVGGVSGAGSGITP